MENQKEDSGSLGGLRLDWPVRSGAEVLSFEFCAGPLPMFATPRSSACDFARAWFNLLRIGMTSAIGYRNELTKFAGRPNQSSFANAAP